MLKKALPATLGLMAFMSLGAGQCYYSRTLVPPSKTLQSDNAYFCKCLCINKNQPPGVGHLSDPLPSCLHPTQNPNIGGTKPSLDDLKLDCDIRICPALEYGLKYEMAMAGGTCDDVNAIACSRAPNSNEDNAFQKEKCNNDKLVCFEKGLCILGCSPASDCGPPACIDPPGDPVSIQEFLAREDAAVQLENGSAISFSAAGETTVLDLSGLGNFTGRPCLTSLCPLNGVIGGRMANGTFGGLPVVDGSFTFGFRGTYDASGSVTIPGSSSETIFLFKHGGVLVRLEPQLDMPVRGVIDFAARTVSFSGTFLDDDGSVIVLEIRGNLTSLPTVANAGADQVIECSSHHGSIVTLDASLTYDADGPIFAYSWKGTEGSRAGQTLGRSANVDVMLPVGQHAFELTIVDSKLKTSRDRVKVTVRDTTPPSLSEFVVNPSCIWPPNGKLVSLGLASSATYVVVDKCDPSPQVRFSDVRSDEPDGPAGNGSTGPDVLMAGDHVCVRAERSGEGDGRTYELDLTATDVFGNSASSTTQVVVPHDQRAHCRPPSKLPGCPEAR